jgi:tRNA pseudouridine55 synthase
MDKAYVATMYLGLETDTQDIEGEVVKVYEKVDISIEELQGVMNSFKGRITQVPPLYSAIKVNRVPLYKWVRKGIKKKCPQREIEIYELELTSFNPPKVEFSISCSKGTYVRTLCAEIGKKLGCGACLIALRRLKTGPFSVKRAISLNTLKEAIRGEIWQNYLMDLNEALIDFMAITLNDNQETQIKQGRFILWTEKLTNTLIRGLNKKGQLIALLKPHEEKGGIQLRPVRVF